MLAQSTWRQPRRTQALLIGLALLVVSACRTPPPPPPPPMPLPAHNPTLPTCPGDPRCN